LGLLTEVSVELIFRMMVLLFWITYNCCSGHLILLYEILQFPCCLESAEGDSYYRTWWLRRSALSSLRHGSTARQVLCGVSCGAYRMCLTSKVLLSIVFIYFSELSDTEQSLT
jgi:hypothetical protein